MAVILEKNYSRCQVTLENGIDNEGNPIFVSRTFGRIDPETTHQDLYDVMQALLELQELPVRVLRRLDDGELIVE
ncbi:DUF1659 domain-containing protein [Dethiobacter alkaliphilus]|uniref:DUF1659 domain-containing protein n=1 Tax=Dethiobacter alkaliphilus AHT 1 TaxID=555088 RepID=C0GF76_DETAL|nr:DUF1659 domain-containing protein [Dethiobacter alkaliphilus]EEG77836.1 protein of unknown function DUF1659 [Dethiobacter alkaliphilus AHT 1]